MESDIQQAKKLVLDWQKATDNAALAEMPACWSTAFECLLATASMLR